MQRLSYIVVAVMLGALAACSSSSEPLAVEFTDPMMPDAGATVTGAAVTEGIVCAEGTFDRLRMENAEGQTVTEEEGQRLWEEAMESGAEITMILYDEFNCSDGSGAISIVTNNVVQPSTLDFDGSNDVGTWEIQGGTGDYENYTGAGTNYADFGDAVGRFVGEVAEA